MASTRKTYVENVTGQLLESPRTALAGNGIQPRMLAIMASRPDIMAKLATFVMMTKNYMKNAKGLKKAPNLQIKAYKNFNEFNRIGRDDLENFKQGLPPEDLETFENNKNVLVILALPDDLENQTLDEAVAVGKSVALKFDKAVRNEYKIPGGFYVIIMFGDSVIRPKDEKRAEMKAAVNERKSERRKPAAIKNEIKAKTRRRKEIENVRSQMAQLQNNVVPAQSVQSPAPVETSIIEKVLSFI